uniref:Pitrilysin metalloproteinase 1 n=1 Tax=Oncorhynchus tshawytscha TaxID=74940 RepID=A0A8C8IV26_ONCTS
MYNVMQQLMQASNGLSLGKSSFQGHNPSWRFRSTPATERALQYQAGQKIHGFTVKEVVDVPDLFLTAVKLTHDNTGAQYLHAARDDKNNLFSVQLRTTPMDNTGVPHILEHTVLCGSEKYPCRDPFFKMLNRSLSTFMNAFTASDFTMYPFSTQNGKDFQNLLSVYLDAVFFPCLGELDFRQEGWRLENENPTDPSSPLVFKGVVFNEMKGAFSDNEQVYAQHLQNKLYPDHTYGVVSGGEPLAIPDLSWEQLKHFHATHYHPSNARFFTYGDLPLEQHLKQIHEEALSKFERTEPDTAVPNQVHWDRPREDHVTCSPDVMAPDAAKQNTLCMSYLLGDNGFEEERIEALLHKIEIQMKHQSTSFGLSLASYIASCWNHDGDPVQLLKICDSVTQFRQALKDNPRFLQEKVVHYFKDNTHRLTLSMSPDEAYLEKQVKAEEEKLQKKIQALSESDKKDIYEKGLELLSIQSQTQDASCLPALNVSDIEPTIAVTHVEMGTAGGVPVQYCEQPTNGMVYFRAMCSLNSLPEDLKLYVPLFCSVITKMGCGGLDYRQQDQQMELKTGGMSISTSVNPDYSNMDMYEQGVLLSSSCLERNLPDMFHLWSDIFNSPHFDDEERLRVLVMMSAQELANGISNSGHMYAMTRAARNLTPTGELQETFGGMEQVKFMKRVAEMPDLTQVLRTLPRIKRHILNPMNMRCAVNATPQKMSNAAGQLDSLMCNVSSNKKDRKPRPLDPLAPPGSGPSRKLVAVLCLIIPTQEPNFKPCQMKTFFPMPFPINFVSECIRTVPFTHEDCASLNILARMMTSKYLHGEIREKGGAYGGGARMGGGLFTFYSYRDPNTVQTLSAFRKGVDWAISGQFTQQDINEAKLSVFSAVDSPVAPSDKGMGRFLSGITDELKQAHRERLFAVTDKNINGHLIFWISVLHRYLGIGQRTCGVAILGPENDIIKKDPSWVVK